MRSLLVLLVSGTLTIVLAAQSSVAPGSTPLRTVPDPPGPAAPAFEVASVKPGNPDPGRLFGFMPLPNGQLRVISVPVSMLIEQSYGLRSYQLAGAPDWTRSSRVDIEARMPVGTPPAAMMEMMRHLLAERFMLRTHVETREVDVYALVLARPDRQPGPMLTRTVEDCDAVLAADAKKLADNPTGMVQARTAADGRRLCAGTVRGTVIDGTPTIEYLSGGETMAALAEFIGGRVDRLVIDRTGLTGRFNFELRFSQQGAALTTVPTVGPVAAADPGVPLTDAVLSLGLRLQPERAPIQVLVIDSIQQPTPD